jgi:hypothetical protein
MHKKLETNQKIIERTANDEEVVQTTAEMLAETSISAIRSAAKNVMDWIEDVDCLPPKLERLRNTLAEARRDGVSDSAIEETLEEVRKSYPEVDETWADILAQIEVYVWLEDPDGNRVRGDTEIIDRLVWENYGEDLLLEGVIQGLHDDLEANWEIVEPLGTVTLLSPTPTQEVARA